MLRLIVLTLTYSAVFIAGWGMARVHMRGRQQAVLADRAALDVRATFLESTIERQLRIRADAANPHEGRHRATPRRVLPRNAAPTRAFAVPKPPTLLTATLTEATAILATQRAQRVQQRREFVDLMTTLTGPARIRQHVTGYAQVS